MNAGTVEIRNLIIRRDLHKRGKVIEEDSVAKILTN